MVLVVQTTTEGDTMTAAHIKRATAMMNEFAKETVTVEPLGSTLYAFGSELACLRIFAKYQSNGAAPNKKARIGHSKNRDTWFFSLELSL